MKLLGFDFDGVIINSSSAMEKSWESIRFKYMLTNEHHSFEEYKRHVGKPFPVIMQELSLEDYLPEIQVDYFSYTKKNQDKIKIYSGINEVLQACKENNKTLKTALITSKTKKRTKEIVDYFGLDFDIILCPEDTIRGKPHPDPLLLANKLLRIAPSNSIYLGDMESDLVAAVSAGWKFMHAGWGYGEIPQKRYSQIETLTYPHQALKLIKDFLLK